MTSLTILALLSLASWVAILLLPSRPWDMKPIAEDEPAPPLPDAWPPVRVLVPARNEADTLPATLPPLLEQDYPGTLRVVLIDDRSDDGTAEVARGLARELGAEDRLVIVDGEELPAGWSGKVWALEQGARRAFGGGGDEASRFVLLTDADIRHEASSVRRLVAESLDAGLGLNSRMARLRAVAPWERLLIPAFVFFFNLLYPMRRANRKDDPLASAAGGCVLLSREAYEAIGGFESIRDELIDDVNLARQVKGRGFAIRLSVCRRDVTSWRGYDTLGSIWRMVRRTAFTELRYSWARLVTCVALMTIVFLAPVASLLAGVAAVAAAGAAAPALAWVTAGAGALALGLMAALYAPSVRLYELPIGYAFALPLIALLYMGMTVDSAVRHALGHRSAWRGRAYATSGTATP